MGDEARVELAESADQGGEGGAGEGGEGDAGGRFVEALHVLVWTEEAEGVVGGAAVSLHPFKAFEAVVENASCWVEGEVLVGRYSWCQPA